MNRYAALLEITKLLFSEDDADRTAEAILRRLLDLTEAERGFVVVREGDGFEARFDVDYDRASVGPEERRFSRSVIRTVIDSKSVLHSPNLLEDLRFRSNESAISIGARSVLAVPLFDARAVYGAVYLERRSARGGFSEAGVEVVSDIGELAGHFMRRALEREVVRRRVQSLEHDLLAQYDFQGIVTRNASMLAVLRQVAQVAPSDATVLVQGETGTGKELVARALHLNSRRAHRPFVALHSTALPPTILESELFGHARGAFTGADRDRPGRIAAAAGGTLFLDEIAEIPADVQAKLLRFLQFGEIQRIGSDKTERVDVRVLAATHRDLKAMVDEGAFRRDLYYRLKVIDLVLPPLRERHGDVPILVDTFLGKHWKRTGRARFSPRAMALLEAYDYPGNVRELAHAVERACVLAQGPDLDVDLLPGEIAQPAGAVETDDAPLLQVGSGRLSSADLEALRDAAAGKVERQFLVALLDKCGGNISAASRESGIHRSHLQRLMTKHGMRST